MSDKRGADAPASWYGDPFGRHEYRYWDGTSWTAQVRDGEVERTEPVQKRPKSRPPFTKARIRRARWGVAAYFAFLIVVLILSLTVGRSVGGGLVGGVVAGLVALYRGWSRLRWRQILGLAPADVPEAVRDTRN